MRSSELILFLLTVCNAIFSNYITLDKEIYMHVHTKINVKVEFIYKCYRLTHRKQQKLEL